MTHQLASPLMVWRLKVSHSHFINKYFFRITASAWAARTWTTGEAEVDRPARRDITILLPASSSRKAMSSRELQGRGSTWGRGGSSQAQAYVQNCCKHPLLWTAMTKVSRDENFTDAQFSWLKHFCQDLEVQGNRFLLSARRWLRRPASASWRRRRRGRRRGRTSSRSRGSSSRNLAAVSFRSLTLREKPKRVNRLWGLCKPIL